MAVRTVEVRHCDICGEPAAYICARCGQDLCPGHTCKVLTTAFPAVVLCHADLARSLPEFQALIDQRAAEAERAKAQAEAERLAEDERKAAADRALAERQRSL